MMHQSISGVTEQSQVGHARREAIRLAKHADFNEVDVGKVALIATELANNLVKHATGGQMLMRAWEHQGGKSFELLSLDRGPGIENLSKCLEDGHSTAGSPGTGLGAIRRTAHQFDIYSQSKGTVAVALVSTSPTPATGVVHQAKPSEPICGDAWLVKECSWGSLCVIADGLGHGVRAAAASTAVVDSMRETLSKPSTLDLIETAHHAAMSTCGASIGVAILDMYLQEIRFAGVGNISAVVLNGSERNSFVSYDGVIGHQYRKVKEFTYHWSKESVLVMHSDGLGSRWDLKQYPGLLTKHPSLIAGVLYRDFARNYDDITVVVMNGAG
jgi:anti-sigma regulatory factor (Ser/Thr protein kinase)